MAATATSGPVARRDPYANSCPTNTVFWTCSVGPFVGCCSHDPCHDGYCHDLNEESLKHMSLRGGDMGVVRRGASASASTTTITYTLVRFTELSAGTFLSNTTVESSANGTGSCSASAVLSRSREEWLQTAAAASESSSSLRFDTEKLVSVSVVTSKDAVRTAVPTSSLAIMSEQKLTYATAVVSSPAQSHSQSSKDTARVENGVTAIAVLNTILTGFKTPGAAPTVKPTSQASSGKSLATSRPTSTTTAGTSTSSTSTSSTLNPTAPPVPGAKKSARTIAGISLGMIASVIVILLLIYCCISRKKRAKKSGHEKKRRRKHSRTNEGVDIVVVKVKDGEDEPMTPGGAKLEEQRGRMLSRERLTGFRALGMTARDALVNRKEDRGVKSEWEGSESERVVAVPTLMVPTPAMRASEHPASHLGVGMGVLGAGLVHPAYRGGGTRSELDLSTWARQSVASPASSKASGRFYDTSNAGGQRGVELVGEKEGHQHRVGLAVTGDDRSEKTVSWTAGSDVIDVLVPGPLAFRPEFTAVSDGSAQRKPTFDEATAKWAAVVSPTSIGQALSSPGGMTGQAAGQGKESEAGNVAMSTENEVTSPVEEGGLQRPVKRNAFRGFDEIIGGDGRLK